MTAGGKVAGLLLAAGGGSRLGTPKALVGVGGQLLVERGLKLLTAAGCDPVVVVLGAAAAAVRASADLSGATVVVNRRWEQGLGSSVRAGLEALPAACPAVVVALADQPLVRPPAVERLVAAWRAGAVAAVATWEGQPGNPVLLAASLWPDVRAGATGDAGARAVLRRRPELVTLVPCDDAGAPDDVDTPEDLRRVAARLDGGGRPGPAGPAT